MKIEVGAGGRAAPGFLAVDINPRRCDVMATATALPFRDGSIEALRAVDVLEHMSYRDTDRVLAEWARVCAPHAELYVQVPDADRIIQWYTGSPRRLLVSLPAELPQTPLAGAAWRLLGGHADGERVDVAAGDDWRWNAHYAMFSTHSLRSALARAGFGVSQCTTNQFPNLLCWAYRQ